jgi:Domain of unknown function (DUF4265)
MSDELRNSAVLTKVAIKLPDGRLETLWAEPLGPNRYRLMNLPFVALGFSWGDIVTAKGRRGSPIVKGVVKRSGHSTYRITLQDGVQPEAFEGTWRGLREIGCTFERFTSRTVGVDVPPTTDIQAAYQLPEDGMASGTWWFDEVHVGHPLGGRKDG